MRTYIWRAMACRLTMPKASLTADTRRAANLCHAEFCNVFRFDGQPVYFAAAHGTRPDAIDAMRSRFPLPPGRGFAAGRAILSNAIEGVSELDARASYAFA